MLKQQFATTLYAFVFGTMSAANVSAGTDQKPMANAASQLAFGTPPATIQDESASQASDASTGTTTVDDSSLSSAGDEWRASLTAWIWIVGMEGTVGVRNIESDVSASFGDILKDSDSIFAFSGRLEVGKGAFGFFLDGMYSKLGVDDKSILGGPGRVDISTEIAILDFGLSYRLGTWEPSGEAAKSPHDLTLDLYAGARYTSLELELDPEMLASRSRSVNWFDPIVGAKLILPLNKSWHIALNGDIGGFGAGSDFTWSSTGVFGYDFHLFGNSTTLYAGYRALGQDYSKGSGADRFVWDMIQHGPIIGLTLWF